MKLIRKKSTSGAESVASYEIPNSTVTIGAIIITVIQILGTLLGNYLTSNPKRQTEQESFQLKERNFQVQLFQRVLELENEQERSKSLKLLIASGLIEDEDSQLTKIAVEPSQIPKWEKRPLEPFNPGSHIYNSGSIMDRSDSNNIPKQNPEPGKRSTTEPMMP